MKLNQKKLEAYKKKVKKMAQNLRDVPEEYQTEEVCSIALKESAYSSLSFIINQTEEQCIVAVKKNLYCLKFVHNQTEAIQLASLKKSEDVKKAWALFEEPISEAVCLKAVKIDGNVLGRIPLKHQTEEVCNEAVAENKFAEVYARNITYNEKRLAESD